VDIFGGKLLPGAGFVVGANQLRQMQSAGQPGRPGAHDQYISIEPLALRGHQAILANAGSDAASGADECCESAAQESAAVRSGTRIWPAELCRRRSPRATGRSTVFRR